MLSANIYNKNNKPSVIPQAGSGEGSVYADLTLLVEEERFFRDRPSAQIKKRKQFKAVLEKRKCESEAARGNNKEGLHSILKEKQ